MRRLLLLVTCMILALVKPNWSLPPPHNVNKQLPSGFCSYGSCPELNDPNLVYVHMVPHSHDDVGWLKTVDQYYYGARNGVQRAGVQYILDSVIQELAIDPTKRFIQVETSFFWQWWNEQNDHTKDLVRQLVNSGQLEFTGGGWSMHDEATVHYSSLIDNMALGLQKLKETFGECGIPRIAWQIDPFGHSREQASLFAQMGFDAEFFARIDYRDKDQRRVNKTLQVVWEGSDSLEEPASLFTGAFTRHYSAPDGFCFDIRCTDEPIQDNMNLKDYNADAKVSQFIATVREQLGHFKNQNHLMFTMGDDFTYQNAAMYYKGIDKLIEHVNEGTSMHNIHVLYSSPTCFVKALNDAEEVWPLKTDDFFPYASGPHDYWTGYFTSRPSFKYHERQSNNLLQAAKQVDTLSPTDNSNLIEKLKMSMGIAQHHDAITGTAKQNVDYDYHLRLSEGQTEAHRVLGLDVLSKLNLPPDQEFFSCPLRVNQTECSVWEDNERVLLSIYNPLPRTKTFYIRMPLDPLVPVKSLYDDKGNSIQFEYYDIRNETVDLPGRDPNSATQEMIFEATDIPPLGYKIYYLDQSSTGKAASKGKHLTGRMLSEEELQDDIPIALSLNFYTAEQDSLLEQNSGAYIFNPASDDATMTQITDVEIVPGSLVTEWRVHLDIPWASYTISQYANSQQHYDIQWNIGPIPIEDGDGKEVIMMYNAPEPLNDNGEFFTDSNGRQMIRRVKDQRFSYDLENGAAEEPIASNYYPVTSGIFVSSEDEQQQLSILTDRSQGGSSIERSSIELMIHRQVWEDSDENCVWFKDNLIRSVEYMTRIFLYSKRLLRDDGKGVGEALNETAYGSGLTVTGIHNYFFGNKEDSTRFRRLGSQQNYLQPVLTLFPTDVSVATWLQEYPNKVWSGLTQDLPENVNILTLERWGDTGNVLLRLEHLFQPGEHSLLSQEVNVDISNLFSAFTVSAATELTLSANAELASLSRLHWNTEKWGQDHQKQHPMSKSRQNGGLTVNLKPMEIKTFLLEIQTAETTSTEGTTGTTSGSGPMQFKSMSLMLLVACISLFCAMTSKNQT